MTFRKWQAKLVQRKSRRPGANFNRGPDQHLREMPLQIHRESLKASRLPFYQPALSILLFRKDRHPNSLRKAIFYFFRVTSRTIRESAWKCMWPPLRWSSWRQVVSHWRQCEFFRSGSISRQSQWGMLLFRQLFLCCKMVLVFPRMLECSEATTLSTDTLHYRKKSLRPAVNFPSILHTEGRLPLQLHSENQWPSTVERQETFANHGMVSKLFCCTFGELLLNFY